MQMATQMLNSNQKMINHLELQLSQMATQIGERKKGIFTSQPIIDPKNATSLPSSHAQINTIHIL